jgi:hypothetical protein
MGEASASNSAAPRSENPAVVPTTAARVIIVADDQEEQLVRLLTGELAAQGFETQMVPKATRDLSPSQLRQLARNEGAVAAFALVITPEGLEVWIADRVTGKVTLREVIPNADQKSDDGRVIALQAVELLRWSLRETGPAAARSSEIPNPPPAIARLRSRPELERVAGVGVGLAGTFWPSIKSGGVEAQFNAEYWPSVWGGRALLAESLTASRAEGKNGRIELHSLRCAVLTGWAPWTMSCRVRLELGPGVSLMSTQLRGVVQSPLIAEQRGDISFGPVAGGGLRWVVARSFALTARGEGALYYPQTNLLLGGEHVGSLSLVHLSAALEASVTWGSAQSQ